MNSSPESPSTATIRPPQLIQSLVGGFNTVASNIHLIILPVALDLLLWFGPHVRVKALMEPGVASMMRFMRQSSAVEMLPMLDSIENFWKLFFNQYNLLTMLSTFPVGVPTLMVGHLPLVTPTGTPRMIEVPSYGTFFLGWVGLTLLGFALGCLYFAWIANTCARTFASMNCDGDLPDWLVTSITGRVPALRLKSIIWEMLQVLAMVLLLVMIAAIIMIPTLIITTLLALISPMIAQFALLLIVFSAVWFMVPLIFSPHGIFICGQSVLNAMMNSSRVVRHSLPATGMFLLAAIVLYQGLGVLWNTPPDSSWMALVGVLGHAFITTGLLAASFIFYRNGLTYVQAMRKVSVRRDV